MRKSSLLLASVPLLLASAAGRSDRGEAGPRPADPAAVSGLHEIFDAYFEASLELNPVFATSIGDDRYNDRFANSIGPEHRGRSLALERRYLDRIEDIDPAALSDRDRLSWQIFKRNRETAIEGFRYPSHLLPVSQFFSTPNFFAQMGSGASLHPFRTVKDYDDFLGRVDGFIVWVDQAIANMREGMERGIVQPRVLMEKTLPQLEAQITDEVRESLFYRPVADMPEAFPESDRERLRVAYESAIERRLVPAYRKLRDFIRDEYLPATRETVGLGALPGGDEWYAFLVRRTTTTDLTPARIHEIGLAEVDRIHGEMESVMREVGFEGSLTAFFAELNRDPRFYFDEPDELIQGYRALRSRIEPLAARLFDVFPKADFEIRPVEAFRARSSAGASYQGPSADGSRPGVFYVNTYDPKSRPKWAMESLFLHEAIPGHHFQIAIQQELEDLPRFRRFGGYTAYTEGWALYAESLGGELGVYTDPYQRFGALNAELWRAVRLVTDTGMHAFGWSRERVLEYMYENTAVTETRAVAEAERYIAIPSQALAYKIGQRKIAELRARAERRLGDRFDVKAFHAQVLKDGALPLDVLETRIDGWLEAGT